MIVQGASVQTLRDSTIFSETLGNVHVLFRTLRDVLNLMLY